MFDCRKPALHPTQRSGLLTLTRFQDHPTLAATAEEPTHTRLLPSRFQTAPGASAQTARTGPSERPASLRAGIVLSHPADASGGDGGDSGRSRRWRLRRSPVDISPLARDACFPATAGCPTGRSIRTVLRGVGRAARRGEPTRGHASRGGLLPA